MASIGNDLVFHNSAAEPVIYPIARHIFSTCRMGLQQLSKVRAGWAADAGELCLSKDHGKHCGVLLQRRDATKV
ncbi:MAG: hypothetical protein KVP17_001643 [Porospora cf. gigantea B]|uniref:uncharacterized protein n=1 Tax=Porospora cf. gigantea B TaxID=2853592 RepID=UPI003571EB15|nr:MAG: hypothetical protein KVP17_001643 [Porospora cf. gigantea B]